MSLLLIFILGALVYAILGFNPEDTASGGRTLAIGYVLLTAFFAGKVAKAVRLPKLTGYIAAGILVGPSVFGLVSDEIVQSLQLVNGMAIALIALTAGNELDLRTFRPLLGTIRWITLTAVVGTAILLTLAVLLASNLLPFMALMNFRESLAVALVLGVVMAAQSPAVVVALRDEMDADGPVTRTVLGVVVIADLVVILLFALASSLAKGVFGAPGDVGDTVLRLSWELMGSLLIGVVVGALLSVYLRKVQGGAALFVLTVAFVVAEVGQRVHLDPLLLALAAGVFVRNVSKVGDVLHHVIESASLPVYVLFFAVTGAGIHLEVLAVVGIPAALFVLVRAGGLIGGTRLGAKLAKAPPAVGRFAGFGLLPQAGLALALSLLFARTFPEFGEEAAALTLGVVALNEILAPALYRMALLRSGEAGGRTPDEDAEPEAIEPA